MAGGGGEEENYWPGYVDALTTMTMVLTFIMMILGVVIFSMSENVSKQLVQQIAQAAKIEIKGGGTAEQVKDQVIAAIKASKQEAEDTKESSELTQHAMRGDNYATPAPATLPSAKTKLPSPAQPDQQESGKLTGMASTDMPKAGKADDQKTSPPPSPIDKDPSKAEPDKRIDSAITNDVAPMSSGITMSQAGSILTIAFQKRVVQLDDVATKDLHNKISSSAPLHAARSLEVKGYADVTVLGVTEARRIAYYRTMLIRKQMLAAGFQADKIVVRIEDAPAADGDLVRVFAK